VSAEDPKVKIAFEARTGIILGGQVPGASNDGELINTISTCIRKRMTADSTAILQTGSHSGLTASPIAYQIVKVAEEAVASSRQV